MGLPTMGFTPRPAGYQRIPHRGKVGSGQGLGYSLSETTSCTLRLPASAFQNKKGDRKSPLSHRILLIAKIERQR